MVFIHAGFTTHESFMKQYDLLPDKRMIFADLPDCGKSRRKFPDAFSFESVVLEVVRLIEELSLNKKVILITHSDGGLIIKEILIRIPNRIDKIVIGNTNVQESIVLALYKKSRLLHSLETK